MKKLLIPIIMIIMTNILSFSQGIEVGLGIVVAPSTLSDESETLLNINMGIISEQKHLYFGLDASVQFKTKGKYYQGWNQFPEDIKDSGVEWSSFNLIAGYYNNNYVFAGILGACFGTEYHNCYDDLQILADNGKWHETNGAKHQTKLNIGVEFKYFIPLDGNDSSIPLSLMITNRYFGTSLGIAFKF